ncbi:hypothetical protein RFI_33176 [Reticulomyxa filosa]|uniref:Uncharacterized protein n=1 Tax=Reticulomyxa filosa TaxID=46433 RepID=X6LS51_RETFI|nr:hypothetical protein RFI_33176 [Reticulomyxa filosa]|eukprot:ETO04221.1 hypothetical protein RFI_33176 [Reticulomyxa filosa]
MHLESKYKIQQVVQDLLQYKDDFDILKVLYFSLQNWMDDLKLRNQKLIQRIEEKNCGEQDIINSKFTQSMSIKTSYLWIKRDKTVIHCYIAKILVSNCDYILWFT